MAYLQVYSIFYLAENGKKIQTDSDFLLIRLTGKCVNNSNTSVCEVTAWCPIEVDK